MIISDIVALAKSGFTVADIKELMAMDRQPAPEPDTNNTQPAPDGSSNDGSTDDHNPLTTGGDTPTPPNSEDHTKVIESLQAEITKLKADLKTAQTSNAHEDMSGLGGDKYNLEDTFRAFM